MTHCIFITGGVISSLGKGLTSASLGAILEARGLSVTFLKLDPYLNVDPGTMNPLQHGEVFVTADGAETDLDLGHYERFVRTTLARDNNVTAGKIYANVLRKERRGDYAGQTVQVIPHVTDEIKHCITKVTQQANIAIIEIGGTVGDIESLPFLEAIRQLRLEWGSQKTLFIHLALVPFVKTAGEIKTKPVQHSIKELRSIGIQADLLICRTEHSLSEEARRKISLFTNVAEAGVIALPDAKSIYEIPLILQAQAMDELVIKQFGLSVKTADLSEWQQVVTTEQQPLTTVTIAMVGKYMELTDCYKSLNEAIRHAGIKTQTKIIILPIDAEQLTPETISLLADADGIIVPGGFGVRGIAGKILAAQYAREQQVPYLGICLGMQIAVIEFARHVMQQTKANSTEFDLDTPYPVISLVSEWQDIYGAAQIRHHQEDLGGTMRLGNQRCQLQPGSLVAQIYGQAEITERHRHRYEVTQQFVAALTQAGLKISGTSADGQLVEMIELPTHPWFVACQFHPEFTSTPRAGHPLFTHFVNAARYYRQKSQG